MDTVCATSEGDIYTPVDEKPMVGFLAEGAKRVPTLEQAPRVCAVIPEHHRDRHRADDRKQPLG